MAELLLDKTVFMDYCHGDAGARDIVDKILQGGLSASVSPLTLVKLWSAIESDRRMEIGLTGLLTFLEEAPLSAGAARTAGIWLAQVEEQERGPLHYHTIVAATAKERGEPICTRDAEAFTRFYPEVITY